MTRATDVEALALRYGFFYGPGTSIANDGWTVALVRRRKLPFVGSGAGVWSFIHVDDVAAATLAAMDHGGPGLYNVVDDEPASVAAWLPFLARAVGAPPPRRVPAWLARLAIGEGGVSMMTSIRGGSNAKARRELAWQPVFASWRRGFIPTELTLLFRLTGMPVLHIWGGTAGKWGRRPLDPDEIEIMVVARRAAGPAPA